MSKHKRMASLGGQSPSEADRKHERFTFKQQGLITLLDQDLRPVNSWSCSVRDISAGGACVMMGEMPCEGDTIIIAIPPTAKTPAMAHLATIRHVGLLHNEWFRVGIQFLAPTPRVQSLIEEALIELHARAGVSIA